MRSPSLTELEFLVTPLFWGHPSSFKQPITTVPVSNFNKTHWLIELDFSGIVTFICCSFPIWGERMIVQKQK